VSAGVRRWPLLLIAAPAAVAIWSGWVGLGELCGFGPVRLLPGISGLTVNTAITLPVGVEAYAAYALGAWMSPASPPQARRFARWSALGALAYGMAGQIIYHLLAAAHASAAPWPVVVVVSCMPVAVLGLAAALTHLLRAADATNSQLVTARPIPSRPRKRACAPPWRPGIRCRSTSSPGGSRCPVAWRRKYTGPCSPSNGHPSE
jgi:hypothetical protein